MTTTTTLTTEQKDAALSVAVHYAHRIPAITDAPDSEGVFRIADDTRTYGYMLDAAQEGTITPDLAPGFIAAGRDLLAAAEHELQYPVAPVQAHRLARDLEAVTDLLDALEVVRAAA